MEGPIAGELNYKGRTLFVAATDANDVLRITEIRDAATNEPVELTDDLMNFLREQHKALIDQMRSNADEYIEDYANGIDPEEVGF